MALQDIVRGKGVGVIDPHGDLVERLLTFIPKRRVPDTIYLDASAPIPIDFMHCKDDKERDSLADDLYVLFQAFSESSGERMNSILRRLIPTLLSVPGTTFLDIHDFLAHEERRRQILSSLRNKELHAYWTKQFPHLPKDSAMPILSRMAKFVITPSLRAMLGEAHPKLDIFEAMEQRKILLINLAKVGKESGTLLGKLFVSKIQQAAMRRQIQDPTYRIPFYLYVDEFQNFQTSAFDVILSEAGKYRLCLTLAHQYVDQLDKKIRASIFGNVSTFILFRLSEADARLFRGEVRFYDSVEDEYVPLRPEDLTALRKGRAVYRSVSGEASYIRTPSPPRTPISNYAELIKNRTIEQYSCQRLAEPLKSAHDEPQPTGRPTWISPHQS